LSLKLLVLDMPGNFLETDIAGEDDVEGRDEVSGVPNTPPCRGSTEISQIISNSLHNRATHSMLP
jgi:hypothetical protein